MQLVDCTNSIFVRRLLKSIYFETFETLTNFKEITEKHNFLLVLSISACVRAVFLLLAESRVECQLNKAQKWELEQQKTSKVKKLIMQQQFLTLFRSMRKIIQMIEVIDRMRILICSRKRSCWLQLMPRSVETI